MVEVGKFVGCLKSCGIDFVTGIPGVGGLENGGGRMRATWASEVFMDGGLAFSHRCLFDDQLGGRRFIARTEVTRKRRATLMACQAVCFGAL